MNKKWELFIGKLGPYPVSSKAFWQIINKTKKSKSSGDIPTLKANNQIYKTDREKSQLFSEILSSTFKNQTDIRFNNQHKDFIGNEIQKMYLTPLKADNYFNINDIFTAINKLGIGKSPGEDGIHNIFLKNLPFDYVKKFILRLVNLSIYSDLPEVWKKATITMIPKKDQKSENPNEYRPVSLTSCLSKLIERLIKKSLYTFLEDKKLPVAYFSTYQKHLIKFGMTV